VSLTKKFKSSENQLSIALLMSDLSEARELSKVFRKVGIAPHFYQDLRSFWNGTLETIPSLCLVDVKMMSDGKIALKNHPFVKSEQLNLAFYYSEETSPLLYSTYDIFNVGVVCKSDNYSGQIKAILKRLNRLMFLESSESNLSENKNRLEQQMTRVVSTGEVLKEKEFYNKALKSLCGRLEMQKQANDFMSALEHVLSLTKEVTSFSALELNPTGHKLIALNSYSRKYKKIPALWLGQASRNGIEPFAQNMASQVALELLGGELMSLNIRGKSEQPDIVLFLNINDENFLTHFDWESFERYLSGLYSHFELKLKKDITQGQTLMTPWELMSFMDQFTFGKRDEEGKYFEKSADEYSLINIDLTDLTDLIRSKPANRFYWNNFFTDFINRLDVSADAEFKVVSMGIDNIALLVESSLSDKLFYHVKSFVQRYPYWRSFEEADIILSRNMKPEVKMSPFSTHAYLQIIEQIENVEFQAKHEMAKVEAEEKTQKIIWGDAPTQSM
jgi:hypothetical protein